MSLINGCAYVNLIQEFGSEFNILLDVAVDELEQGSSSLLAESVKRVRTGKVIRKPGYDGEFGAIRVFTESECKGFGGQMNLFTTADKQKPAKNRRRVKKVVVNQRRTNEKKVFEKKRA